MKITKNGMEELGRIVLEVIQEEIYFVNGEIFCREYEIQKTLQVGGWDAERIVQKYFERFSEGPKLFPCKWGTKKLEVKKYLPHFACLPSTAECLAVMVKTAWEATKENGWKTFIMLPAT